MLRLKTGDFLFGESSTRKSFIKSKAFEDLAGLFGDGSSARISSLTVDYTGEFLFAKYPPLDDEASMKKLGSDLAAKMLVEAGKLRDKVREIATGDELPVYAVVDGCPCLAKYPMLSGLPRVSREMRTSAASAVNAALEDLDEKGLIVVVVERESDHAVLSLPDILRLVSPTHPLKEALSEGQPAALLTDTDYLISLLWAHLGLQSHQPGIESSLLESHASWKSASRDLAEIMNKAKSYVPDVRKRGYDTVIVKVTDTGTAPHVLNPAKIHADDAKVARAMIAYFSILADPVAKTNTLKRFRDLMDETKTTRLSTEDLETLKVSALYMAPIPGVDHARAFLNSVFRKRTDERWKVSAYLPMDHGSYEISSQASVGPEPVYSGVDRASAGDVSVRVQRTSRITDVASGQTFVRDVPRRIEDHPETRLDPTIRETVRALEMSLTVGYTLLKHAAYAIFLAVLATQEHVPSLPALYYHGLRVLLIIGCEENGDVEVEDHGEDLDDVDDDDDDDNTPHTPLPDDVMQSIAKYVKDAFAAQMKSVDDNTIKNMAVKLDGGAAAAEDPRSNSLNRIIFKLFRSCWGSSNALFRSPFREARTAHKEILGKLNIFANDAQKARDEMSRRLGVGDGGGSWATTAMKIAQDVDAGTLPRHLVLSNARVAPDIKFGAFCTFPIKVVSNIFDKLGLSDPTTECVSIAAAIAKVQVAHGQDTKPIALRFRRDGHMVQVVAKKEEVSKKRRVCSSTREEQGGSKRTKVPAVAGSSSTSGPPSSGASSSSSSCASSSATAASSTSCASSGASGSSTSAASAAGAACSSSRSSSSATKKLQRPPRPPPPPPVTYEMTAGVEQGDLVVGVAASAPRGPLDLAVLGQGADNVAVPDHDLPGVKVPVCADPLPQPNVAEVLELRGKLHREGGTEEERGKLSLLEIASRGDLRDRIDARDKLSRKLADKAGKLKNKKRAELARSDEAGDLRVLTWRDVLRVGRAYAGVGAEPITVTDGKYSLTGKYHPGQRMVAAVRDARVAAERSELDREFGKVVAAVGKEKLAEDGIVVALPKANPRKPNPRATAKIAVRAKAVFHRVAGRDRVHVKTVKDTTTPCPRPGCDGKVSGKYLKRASEITITVGASEEGTESQVVTGIIERRVDGAPSIGVCNKDGCTFAADKRATTFLKNGGARGTVEKECSVPKDPMVRFSAHRAIHVAAAARTPPVQGAG